ncbi:class I SAM-dependent methyltransferase [Streptomyces bambusae]|uniref:class I SAM-dependent methyltransferase n=1 Tax=Streptomyces bambusae TaxID=1550616 RepID=UPI001CFFE341|nr:class I SAM-dependent methyltransferase [Streptomyces bambusae]MCB5169925.1 class I SAM-dependent methyltransferase [Streptomyces bambusae]
MSGITLYEDPGSIFSGTAPDYVRFRRTHPVEVAEYVADLAQRHTAAPRMVDLGCGPGTLTLELAARGVDMVALDPSHEMIAAGRQWAAQRAVTGVDWRVAPGESVGGQPGVQGVSGAVIADALHFMNRPHVLEQLDAVVAERGFVALVCSYAAGSERPWWHEVVNRVRARYVGVEPAAGPGGGYVKPDGHHDVVLRQSAFSRLSTLHFEHTAAYTTEELVAAQRTYAFSSAPVLGSRQEAFEKELAGALEAVNGSGSHTALLQGVVIVGRRP